jgi:3-deoxy-D-manno-octulosonate 8-phosphate phosphatase (KDO 8-P phosphatase)
VKQISAPIRKKAEKIKLLLLDVDGVLTDGGIHIDDRGVETKRFNVRDGYGIKQLRSSGIEVGFITARVSKAVRYRARELGVRIVYEGVADKVDAYQQIKLKAGLTDRQIAYVGDDITDIAVLRKVGWAVAVRDCWPGMKRMVDYVTAAGGGRGAVREIAEVLLTVQRNRSGVSNRVR